MRNLAIAIGALIAILAMVACGGNKGSFVLLNKSTELITRASVTISGQTIELKDIQPTKSTSGFYDVKADSHFDVRIEFQSGKKIRKEAGYVTNGFDFEHVIAVTDADIAIVESKAK